MTKGRAWLAVLILALGLAPSAWLLYDFPDAPQLGFAGDDVMYIGAARSLANGAGYHEPALPGNPWQTKYPPGYPLMLAAILKSNVANWCFWIIAHSWLWLVAASATLAWAMIQTGLTPLEAAAVGALWAANPAASQAGTSALSDVPYCAVLFLALGLARTDKGESWRTGAAGFLVGLASLIRVAGLIAGAAVFLWYLWRKRFQDALWFGACAFPLPAMWTLWSRAHLPLSQDPITTFYLNYTGRWLQTIRAVGLSTVLANNVGDGIAALGGLLLASPGLWLLEKLMDVILLTFALTALGEWIGGGAFAAVAITMAVFHLFWVGGPTGRLLLAASPALLGALAAKSGSGRPLLWIAVLGLAGIADVYATANLAETYSMQQTARAALTPALRFIQTELPADAVILREEQVWLWTGRPAIAMPLPPEYAYSNRFDLAVDRFLLHYKDTARQFGARYILLTPWSNGDAVERGGRFFDAVRSDPGLDRVFARNGIELFAIRR
jgi:hypothetical protein